MSDPYELIKRPVVEAAQNNIDLGIRNLTLGFNWNLGINSVLETPGRILQQHIQETLSKAIPENPLVKVGATINATTQISGYMPKYPVIPLLPTYNPMTKFYEDLSRSIQASLVPTTGFIQNSPAFQFPAVRAINESISSLFFGYSMQPWREQNGLGALDTLPFTTVDIAQIIENIADLRESGQLDEEVVEATIAQAPEIEFPESLLPLYGELNETSEKVADVVLYLSSAQFMLYMICTLITAGTPPVLIATLLMSFLGDPWSQLRATWKREE